MGWRVATVSLVRYEVLARPNSALTDWLSAVHAANIDDFVDAMRVCLAEPPLGCGIAEDEDWLLIVKSADAESIEFAACFV